MPYYVMKYTFYQGHSLTFLEEPVAKIEFLLLQDHMQSAHQVAPTFPCHLCGNTYTDKDSLERHVKVFHEGRTTQLPYTCFICQEKNIELGFKKRGQLEKHLLLVSLADLRFL